MSKNSGGRALLAVLVGVAALGVLFLLVGNPFASNDGSSGDDMAEDGYGDDLTADGRDETGAERTGVALAGLYGEGDMGAVRLRLLWGSGEKPVVDQDVKLLSRRGTSTTAAVSDNLGVVVFKSVPPGRGYGLQIEGEGFKPVMIRGIMVRKADTHDLGDVLLGQNVILRGRVVDASGKPVSESSVSAFVGRESMGTDGVMFFMARQALEFPPPLEEVRTDADGYFSLSTLSDGIYRLEARRGGYASNHKRDVVVSTDRTAATLTLVLGDGARMRGKVTDETGKALAGARVVAVRDNGRRFSREGIQREMTITDENGKYVLDTLSRQTEYRFGVIADGFAPIFDTQSQMIEVEETRDFTLPLGGTLEGVVTDEDTGEPVPDAQVAVFVGRMAWGRQNQEGDNRAATQTARTDKDGFFKISALLPGPIMSAQIKAPGYVTASYSQWTQNQWPNVAAGETTEVKAELESGGVVEGMVKTGGSGEPIAGATVMINSRTSFWLGAPTTTTDENGMFQLVGVRAGRFQVSASADGFAAPAERDPSTEIEMPESGGTITVDLELVTSGSVIGVVTDATGEPVAGVRVQPRPVAEEDANGGRGGRGRRGRRGGWGGMGGGARPLDMTDEKGTFRLKGLSPGRWEVVGESDEYVSSQSKPFRLSVGETAEVELVMVGGGTLSGRVVDENGRWVNGARIRVGTLEPDQVRRVHMSAWEADRMLEPTTYVSDEEGRFVATNIKPGLVLVKATKDGYVTFYKRNVRIQPDQMYENYPIALSKGEIAEGIVRGADGQPVSGAFVAVTSRSDPRMGVDESGEPSDSVEPQMGARTDAQGRFKVENIPTGTYSLVVWFAQGHKAYGRDQDEAAIKRNVTVPARDVAFKLNAAEAGAGNGGR